MYKIVGHGVIDNEACNDPPIDVDPSDPYGRSHIGI